MSNLLLMSGNIAFLILGGSLVASGCENPNVNKRAAIVAAGYICCIAGILCLIALITALEVKP